MSQSSAKSLIEWHRVDIRGRATRSWVRGAVLVAIAMLCLGIPLGGYDRPTSWRIVSWIIGGVALVSGPTYFLLALRKMLAEEIYLAVTTSGIEWHNEGGSRSLRWADVDGFEPLTPVGLRVLVERAPPLELPYAFTSIDSDELAARLTDYRRRALMGLRIKPAR